ncbi:MAG: hypothetical protein KAR39_07320 [Thermoplasmata archaeon]|nr:hypothetical protein [Thermoplasmata archaeon]
MLGRNRGAIGILAIAIVLILPVIAVVDLSKSILWTPDATFESTFDLMYASLGMVFSTQTVDSRGSMGPYTSLELDSNEFAHISYYDETNGDLRYVRWTGTGWLITIVDSAGDVGLYTSLALDKFNRPHISYYDETNGDLRYAYYDGNTFQLSTVDNLRNTGLYTSLVLDSNDTPHISYYEKDSGGLKFAVLNGTEWENQYLDNVGDVGLYTSIGLDPDEDPTISYYDKTHGDLKLIWYNGTAWEAPRVIDAGGNVGLYTSLALGSDGVSHISYFDKTNGDLKFAMVRQWFKNIITIDTSGVRGMYTSLVLDSGGLAHISYYDKTLGNLRYAFGMGFDWQSMDAHSDGDTGYYTSIEVNSDDRPRFSFAGPSFSGSTDPAVGMDCDRGDSCSYVHMVWVETYESARNIYQRVYYQRSDDKGETWDMDIRPISGAWRHFAGYPNLLRSGPPVISVVGKTVHVIWAHEFSAGSSTRGGMFYQRSDDNGDTWLASEVRADDAPSSGPSSGFPEAVSMYADEDYVNVVWQSNLKIYSTRSLVSEADTPEGWDKDFGEYGSVAADVNGRVFITSFDDSSGDLLISASGGGGDFDTEIIDRIGTVGQHTSIVLGTGTYPYPGVAYYDVTNGNLKFAEWNGTHWMISTVDSTGDVGLYASLRMDSNDLAHIAYYDQTKGELRYARWDGASWLLETVDDFGDVGQYASLDLDHDDRPSISYYNDTGKELKFASWNGTAWNIEVVDGSADVGKYSSLAVDSEHHPHISYYDETNQHVMYAFHNGVAWDIALPDNSDQVGEHTSIALDPSDVPVISYYDKGETRLKLTRKFPLGWTPEVLDNAGDVGKYTSIATDIYNEVHISYYDETNQRLKFYSTSLGWRRQTVQRDEMLSYPLYGVARNKYRTAHSPDIDGEDGRVHVVYLETKSPRGDLKFARWNGTQWRTETVDDDGMVGMHTSLVIDSNDLPHICYFDESNTQLKYTHWNGAEWLIEIVDQGMDVGRECSIALDSKEQPHMTYMDVWNGPLKYAKKIGGVWDIGIVGDIAPAAGWYNSLAIDSNDYPHVVYFSWANFAVKYTYYDGERWRFSHVDSKGWQQNSLVLDSNDRPHMAYIDRSELAAKYTYWDGSTWVKQIVDDSSPYVGTHANLALTKDDKPVMSYYDETRGDLRFARPEYPASNTAKVDHVHRVGMYNSLALDDYGIAHMSYYDSEAGALRYAKWVPGGFSVETVDATGDVGLYTSIKLDSRGYPRISYYDESGGSGLFYTEGSVDGNEAWTEEVQLNERVKRSLGSPKIDVEKKTVHVVWDEFNLYSRVSNIFYKKSNDDGTAWPYPDTAINDDTTQGQIFSINPRIQVSGATIEVAWERSETVGMGLFNVELLYDINRANGDPSGWGSDSKVSPNPPIFPRLTRFQAHRASMRTVGNDMHMVWIFWGGITVQKIEYFGISDDLSKVGEMTGGRKGAASVFAIDPLTLRNEIIVVGGENQSGFSDRVTKVDPTTGAEQDYCNLPMGLAYSSVVWDGKDSVFVFGGLSSTGAEAGILRVDLSTTVPGDKCTDTGITLTSGRYGTSAVYHESTDTAYVFGGTDGAGMYLEEIVKWPRLGAPVSYGVLPSERAFTSAVWDYTRNKAFVFGGLSSTGYLDEIVEFRDVGVPDVAVLSNAKLPTPRSATSAAYDGTYTYIIGGRSNTGSISEIVRFNPRGDWTAGVILVCPELPQGLDNSSASMPASARSHIGGIFVVGGENETAIVSEVWRYIPAYDGHIESVKR